MTPVKLGNTCPICNGSGWFYYNGGRATCDGCGGDGKNHYPPEKASEKRATT